MANEELIALLQKLQGSTGGSELNSGLLAQLPPFLAATSTEAPKPAGESRTSSGIGSLIASSIGALPLPAIASAFAPAAGGTGGSSIASSALRAAGGGLTLLPVVSSLLKLFGFGQKKEEPPAFEKYELPAPIRAEAGLSQSGETFLIDRGVGDRIRQLPAPAGATPFASNQPGSIQPGAGAAITVNVQAMDSQSFLDRREDIARAVREAMLQSHSLNDVVSEL